MLKRKSIIHSRMASVGYAEQRDEMINHIVNECNKLA